MTILITGATGLVGSEIVRQCHQQNIVVHYLTTSKDKISTKSNYKGFFWNPKETVIDHKCFEGVDAIINLAGAPISKRWTDSYKKTILNSRLESLDLLKTSLASIEHQVKHVVSASAIGIYPDSLTNYYDEDFPEHSTTFLGEVAQRWERKADELNSPEVMVSKVRIGLVMDDKEGALPQMVRPIEYGMGTAFGKGTQWQSWVHISDLAGIFLYVVQQKIEGVFNSVAPNPVTNNDLTKAIAKTLNKPLILPNIPKFLMKLVLGEMHILLFESQRVSSNKIENYGYHFKFSNVVPALEDLFK
ncbi:TIGR01777 family oxidoreductase [Subsaxibacter sp. CAU 1640]|uniref:TIGR01777 family oxidoreductase n=1 Tax=Subsaxibacter sp. CAU 1640 TaxID=2933271 RepID=UPI002006BD24|nr:TIGR01777 family oxidoreductase [Subsaxibacter sp. CAU 1640]MCK7591432.1 TIGR01777 family oxidoreductase [Subsaxibacter sp. CAU 1640]